ncbi:MAG: isocitrate lyase/PEP mutase family protein [Acidimicrobiales bacterium]
MNNDTNPGATLRALHQPGQPFILANAWDVGSAKMLASLGAKAIGTSSAAHAFTIGRSDMGNVTRDEALAHAELLVAATDLPVSGDFENGFGHRPEDVAETVRMAADAGLGGISIEDTSLPSAEPYEPSLATERIEAAVAAARSLPDDFVLLARADGVMNRTYDIDEGIARLQAFERVGADAVYLPLPPNMDELRRVCSSVGVPVNALAAGSYTKVSFDEFAAAGVARISLGSALARVTHKAINDAATAMFQHGDFSPLGDGISGATIDAMLLGE